MLQKRNNNNISVNSQKKHGYFLKCITAPSMTCLNIAFTYNHESFHTKLQEVSTGKVYSGFTSHPKLNDPNYQYVSEERLDGTLDPTTGQWFGVYKNPKTISNPEIVKEDPKSQVYIDKNEQKFDTIASAKKDTLCDDRTSRQDSRFYNEDGTRDYENFQGKW